MIESGAEGVRSIGHDLIIKNEMVDDGDVIFTATCVRLS